MTPLFWPAVVTGVGAIGLLIARLVQLRKDRKAISSTSFAYDPLQNSGLNVDNMSAVEYLAMLLATDAHRGQFRRDGVTPYITHPAAVARMVSDAAKPVAWLHDVLEDCPEFTVRTLYDKGLAYYIVEAVVTLTKVPGEDYFVYIRRVKANPLAREVKIADIEHNLGSQPKKKNVFKYRKALEILRA